MANIPSQTRWGEVGSQKSAWKLKLDAMNILFNREEDESWKPCFRKSMVSGYCVLFRKTMDIGN